MTPEPKRRGPVRWLSHLGLSRPKPEESVEWEIEHHIAECVDRLVADGWSTTDAKQEAERRFGDRRRYGPEMKRMERGRAGMERRAQWFGGVARTVTGVARSLRRQPGFSAAVVITLGLGIGANATMYTVADRLLLRPPDHIVDHEEVRRVYLSRPSPLTGATSVDQALTYPDYADLKAHSGFSSVAAYASMRDKTIGSGEGAFRASAAIATGEFFPLLGVQPTIGRFYTPEEAAVGGGPLTVVLGHDFWRRSFGADPDVLGRDLEVEGRDHVIVGVAPPGFTGVDLARVDVWLPLEATQRASEGEQGGCMATRTCWWLNAVVRLSPDVAVEAAEEEATRLHHNGRREMIDEGRYPDRSELTLGSVIGARGPEAPGEAQVTRWLGGVSFIVLLIACANVANLLMARGTRRRREIGLRLALGAGRRNVLLSTVGESVILAGLGGLLAIGLAHWGGSIVRSVLLPGVHFAGSSVNGRLLLFTALAAVVAGVFAGVAPALQSSRLDLTRDLGDGGRGASGGRSRLRSGLTVAQAALSVVLLVGAGLFLRSVHEIRTLDLGLDVDRLLLVEIEHTDPNPDADETDAVYVEASRRVRALPGVENASATGVPFQWGWSTSIRVPGIDSLPRLPGGGPYYFPVESTYFETLGLSILQGRPIEPSDVADGERIAVVSATMAASVWPEEGALGQCLLVGRDETECTTVVGVAEDAARGGLQDAPFMAYYLPAGTIRRPHAGLYVRVSGQASEHVGAVSELLRSFSPDVRYADVTPMREVLDPQARAWALGATLFTVFGLLALILAAIGLYSVLAFDVSQRTRELGIRSALGAEKGRLLTDVVLRGTRLALAGVVLGATVAFLAAPRVADLLFDVAPRDPAILFAASLVLCAVGTIAGLVPGLRATRVDPVVALQAE